VSQARQPGIGALREQRPGASFPDIFLGNLQLLSANGIEKASKLSKMMDSKEVYDAAERVNESGSTKFYMETVWRNPDQVGKRQWQYALEMVRRVCGLAGLKDCTNHGDDRR